MIPIINGLFSESGKNKIEMNKTVDRERSPNVWFQEKKKLEERYFFLKSAIAASREFQDLREFWPFSPTTTQTEKK